MRTLLPILTIASLILYLASCKHHPPEPIGGNNGIDTTDNPIDTTQDTTNTEEPCDSTIVYFKQEVLPIFTSSCAVPGCHDAATAQDGVNLTSWAAAMASGEITPGQPWDSDVYENLVENDPDKKMPPPGSGITLTSQQINTIYNWILQGAKNNSCEPTGCDSTNMSYSQNIFPIIQNNCMGCHSGNSPQGGVNLANYTSIKARVDDGRLLGAITHAPGYTPMPYNQPKMNSCNIAKIRNWIQDGAPNN